MKRITLCADDFALSMAGSQRILQLIDLGCLSATSVMVQSPYWPTLAAELAARSGQADVGLHFNLTHAFDDNARPLSHWLLFSQARRLPRGWLRDRLLEQIDLFTDHFQRLPDFIDGHQHVHAFPVIRELLFEVIARRWNQTAKPYLRAPDRLGHPGDARLKACVLKVACAGFYARARRHALTSPPWFAGLYTLAPHADFSRLMQQWLARAPTQALLMCHPGTADPGDAIGPARELEYRYLASQTFVEHCQENRVVIGRFDEIQAHVLAAPVATVGTNQYLANERHPLEKTHDRNPP
ncbi:ChbG/HpnK family deacetylase [Ectopseudomonas hydrolytica]|uniref:ChbG/HpnK family deacetylase n=1 Tax=Ectopseudomonas hydrolytica TaxID=2493633 RepID=A0ABY5A190_9GAMM|nr:ChbG/HpnK family deacetylase [Pseudomonas hydrolytica]OCX15301.1 cellobiose phosphorylase [Stutzerimonas xanthomarina]USR37657.1 ChbG/HpnK family deacetylase [Pseudomonas hydrolytica]